MKKTIMAVILLSAPAFASAVAAITPSSVTDLRSLMQLITGYFQYAIYLIISFAVLMFVWNVFKYFIYGSDDPAAKKEAGLYVMYSLIGFFVILSIWGLVFILTNTFKLQNTPPTIPFGNFNQTTPPDDNEDEDWI